MVHLLKLVRNVESLRAAKKPLLHDSLFHKRHRLYKRPAACLQPAEVVAREGLRRVKHNLVQMPALSSSFTR
jgi:hypothetical protein